MRGGETSEGWADLGRMRGDEPREGASSEGRMHDQISIDSVREGLASRDAENGDDATAPWADALAAARLFAADPHALGGVWLRARAGPVRDAWLAHLATLLPPGAFRRFPVGIDDEGLLGGTDLAASLVAGARVARPGLLCAADGSVLLLAGAERASPGLAARLSAALDTGEVDGAPARTALVALDEGIDEETLPIPLAERLAFHLDLSPLSVRDASPHPLTGQGDHEGRAASGMVEGGSAPRIAPRVRPGPPPPPPTAVALPGSAGEDATSALATAAAACGIGSARAPVFALRAARAAAALDGRAEPDARDLALAARLVLAPRATRLPPGEAALLSDAPADALPGSPLPDEDAGLDAASPEPPEPPSPGKDPAPDHPAQDARAEPPPLADVVLEAVRAALPPGVLAAMEAGRAPSRASARGGAGALRKSTARGRPAGTRPGDPRRGQRLDLAATLAAAAPWQRLRAAAASPAGSVAAVGSAAAAAVASLPPPRRLHLRAEDLRVRRLVQRAESTTIFAVDASGSAALQRLAEAKGAVELLLAEAYVRRTQVALVAFRGTSAETLLPPTRSLARAKRALAELAGGGGTPIAAGLAAAHDLALVARARGRTPLVVVLTDGRANVSRGGAPGRSAAEADALAAARALAADGIAAALLDTGARPRAETAVLAAAMRARYAPLPRADAGSVAAIVRGLEPGRSG